MLHIVVPGLSDKPSQTSNNRQITRLPQLEQLFSKADKQPFSQGYVATLFALYGLPITQNQDQPTAAICYHASNQSMPAETYFLHADPIYLKPDQDRLLAFDFHHQPLTLAEAEQYAQAFNQHFSHDGLTLLTPAPNHWYLAVEHYPALQTHPLVDVLGRNIDLFLPKGTDATKWIGWMNEIQMLLHSLPVNQQRERFGQLPVNGLWFSGGGTLPTTRINGFANIQGDCVLLRGLQKLSAAHKDATLIVEHAIGRATINNDLDTWTTALGDLDTQLEKLMQDELMLYPCQDTAWHWQPKMRRRWWRRNQNLIQV